eukprot:COSAG02_NODE_1295_length_13400_cov_5.691828_13_plen_331_part_00
MITLISFALHAYHGVHGLTPRSLFTGAGKAVTRGGVLEDTADYKVCLLQRTSKSTFMPDVMVFPGGAVDRKDVAVARALVGKDDIHAVTATAAAREAFEESGIVVADTPFSLSPAACSRWRKEVHDDASQFVKFYGEHGAALSLSQLTPLCSFITPDMEHDRLPKGGFDARFFLHCCSDAATLAHAATDANETVKLAWLSPLEALQASDEGEIFLAPPQWYILNDMAGCSELSELASFMCSPAQALSLKYPIKPFVATLDDADRAAGFESALCYPGDVEHPIYPGNAGQRHRMVMAGKFGQQMKYALHRDPSIELPLTEALSDWYQLAKL